MHKFFFAIFITYFSCFIQTAQGVDRKSEGSKLKVKTDAKVKTDTKDEESEFAPFQIGIFTNFNEMHNLEFSNLKMTFIGWEIYWQNKISSDIYWFAGGGVRLGYLSGSMKSTNAQGCNQDNWREPSSGVNYAGGCWHDNFKEFYSDVDYPWGFGFLNIGGGLVYQFSQKLGVVVSTYLEFPGFLRVNLALDYVLPF
jgi:hypothetical protein